MGSAIATTLMLLVATHGAAAYVPRACPQRRLRASVAAHTSRPAFMKLTDEEVEARLESLGRSRKGVRAGDEPAAGGGELSGVLQEIGLFVGALALFVVALTISLS